MTNYAAGWNLGGYSPDPDHVYVTDDWESAVTYLAEIVDAWWDQEYDMDNPDKDGIDGRYLPIHTELHNIPTGPEWHGSVPDHNGYGYHLWITPTDEPVDE